MFKKETFLDTGELYPPYNSHNLPGSSGAFYKYGFLFDPPSVRTPWVLKVSKRRLLNQWIIVLIPMLLLYWALNEKDKHDD